MLGSGAMRPARWGLLLAFLLLGAFPSLGQIPSVLTRPVAPAPANEPSETVTDPLGRVTPRGALRGFGRAARDRNWALAGEYLDLGGRRRIAGLEPADLAAHLYTVLERKLWVPLAGLSDAPEGRHDDGLPAEVDALGTVHTDEGPVELRLRRGTDAMWRFAPDSVARVPDLYAGLGKPLLDRFLPERLASRRLLGLAFAHWLGLAGLLLVSFVLAYASAPLVVRLTRPLAGLRRGEHTVLREAHGPLRLLLGLLVFVAGAAWLGLPARVLWMLRAVEAVLWIAGATWLLTRLLDIGSRRLGERLTGLGRHSASTMVPLGRKTAKVVVVLLALMTMLQTFGVNVTAVVAGLGIGGIAVALAAQKTVENLFGGVSLIVDQPIRVGDLAKVGDVTGTVEEIGLRSTRLRTPERTVVSIPNGQLSTLNIENFARRDKLWLRLVLSLRPDTSPDQIRDVLSALRQVLAGHPRLEQGARVRLIGYGAQSFDLELTGNVPTTNYDEFLAVREDLLLRILELLRESGTGLALPAQVQYDPRTLSGSKKE